MKKYLKLICLLSLLLAVVALITACGEQGNVYTELAENGSTVSVRFDVNGGMFGGINDVFVVDVFNPDNLPENADGCKYAYLLSPDDDQRKSGKLEISKTGYFFAGWYEERIPCVNEEGQIIDADGKPCDESGKEPAYTYAKPWDFSKPLVLSEERDGEAGDDYLTLYAGWIPYYTYEIYAEDSSGDMVKVAEHRAITLNIPSWDTKTGKMDMKNFPAIKDKTFESAFLDEDMTQPAPDAVTGEFDPATGVATVSTIKLYTTWLDGTWYHIYNTKQFKDNSRLNGNYVLHADLDFSGMAWAPVLTTGEFTGCIIGNGHKISNVTVEQADTKQEAGGIFGSLAASASMTDVTFENITYKIGGGSIKPQAYFGLLTGELAEGATLENVTLTGELIIGKNMYSGGNYSIGLVCGNDADHGVDASGITAAIEEGASATVTVEEGSDRVTVSFGG